MIVLDSSLVVALLSQRDSNHDRAVRWYDSVTDDLVTTPLTLAEIDYFASAHAGAAALVAFRRDLTQGNYSTVWWGRAAAESAGVAQRYAGLGVSLTDASLVVLAERLGTTSIATFDERHFRALRPLGGESAFTLLPADA